MNNQVKLPYSFFVQTAQRDYRCPTTAFFREFLQNSVDAKSKNIEIKTYERDGKTFWECNDDGCGMTEEIIRDKLLVLGETSKGEGQTGGFGVAKILIYFAHANYEIKTQNNHVRGSGSSYSIEKTDTYVKGCHALVELNRGVVGRHCDLYQLNSNLLYEIKRSYLPNVKISVNGEVIEADAKCGRKIVDLGEITIHKILNEESNYANVRVNGLHMFRIYTQDQKFKLTLELKTYSVNALTTNRDGFRGEMDSKVSEAIAQICANPSKTKEHKTNLYKGKATRKSPITEGMLTDLSGQINAKLETAGSFEEIQKVIVESVAATGLQKEEADLQVEKISNLVQNQIETFHVTGARVNLCTFDLEALLAYNVYIQTIGKYRKVPTNWEPAHFNEKQKNLLALWGKIVGLVLLDAGHSDKKYDVGYLFDDGTQGEMTLALYQQLTLQSEALHVFYLNPCAYGDQKFFPASQDRRQEVCMWLLALAIHEVNHYLGFDGHNNYFVCAEGSLKLKCFKHISDYISL